MDQNAFDRMFFEATWAQEEERKPVLCHECGEQVDDEYELNERGECLACEEWLDKNPRNED